MGRGKRALAVVAILVALAAASIAVAPRAAAEDGELAGELPVAGGFALVSWSGGPAGALVEAARSRGCNVRSVYANAPGGGFVGYVPGANVAAANRAFLAAYPAGLPASPVLVVCGDPVLPRIVFLDDEAFLSAERRVELREHVASVVRFYAERFGVVVPESTLYVSPDDDVAAAAYRELTGGEYPVLSGGGTVTSTPEAGILAFISGPGLDRDYFGDSHTFDELLAHEYYHMLQYSILHTGGGSYASPRWLTEGTANYGEHLYRAAQAEKYFLEHGEATAEWILGKKRHLDPKLAWKFHLLNGSIGNLHPDDDLAFSILDYDFASAAIAWAVDRSGDPRSHLEYWRALVRTRDWSTAFRIAFGMSSDEFLDAFGRYHISLLEDTPRMRVRIVDDVDGAPIEGVRVKANRHPEGLGVYGFTNPLGELALPVPNGTYQVVLAWSNLYLFVYDETGYARTCYGDWEITVSDQDVDILIKISSDVFASTVQPRYCPGTPGVAKPWAFTPPRGGSGRAPPYAAVRRPRQAEGGAGRAAGGRAKATASAPSSSAATVARKAAS